MIDNEQEFPASLNSSQMRHFLSSVEYADKVLTDIEEILATSASLSPFHKYRGDVSPAQRKVISDYIARIRAQMVHLLEGQKIPLPGPRFSALHTIRVYLTAVHIAIDDLRPQYMRGYGAVPESLIPELNGIVSELCGLVDRLNSYLAQGLGQDLQARLERLSQTQNEVALLRVLEQTIGEHGLVEFRPALSTILDRMETKTFEIAVFGRVSSGKSSLLNHILQSEILPVGVNPITAVPTRIRYGESPRLIVGFADRSPEQFGIDQLAEFATEQHNPSNSKHVVRLIVEVPSSRISNGIVFVDTPGLGSLASSGTQETLAYMPRCDLGVVLIDAGSTLTEEDLSTLAALYEAATPASVLLSKSDLLASGDIHKSANYISSQITSHLGLTLAIQPVSVMDRHATTLEQWFDTEIKPLYQSRQELVDQSIRMKIGALRDAVRATLKIRLERFQATHKQEIPSLKSLGQHLRKIAGEFEEVGNKCDDLVGGLEGFAEVALHKVATEVIEEWHRKGPLEPLTGEFILGSLNRQVTDITNQIQSVLETLKNDLVAALSVAAEELDVKSVMEEEDVQILTRDMPRVDFGTSTLVLIPPFFVKLGKGLARISIERRLRIEIGAKVAEAVSSYQRVLRDWIRRVVSEVQRRFNAQADTYRAQLEGLTAAGGGTAQELEAIRRSLESLESYAELANVSNSKPTDKKG
jgi:GTP-binding protein EngB required for normal cell division